MYVCEIKCEIPTAVWYSIDVHNKRCWEFMRIWVGLHNVIVGYHIFQEKYLAQSIVQERITQH